MSTELTVKNKLEIQLKLKEFLKEAITIESRIDLDIMYTKTKLYIESESILKNEYNRRISNVAEVIANTRIITKIINIVDVFNKEIFFEDFRFDNPKVLFFLSLKKNMSNDNENIKYGKSLLGFYHNNILEHYAKTLNKAEKELKMYKAEIQSYKLLQWAEKEKYKPYFEGLEMLLLECEFIHDVSYCHHTIDDQFMTMYFKTVLIATLEKLYDYILDLQIDSINNSNTKQIDKEQDKKIEAFLNTLNGGPKEKQYAKYYLNGNTINACNLYFGFKAKSSAVYNSLNTFTIKNAICSSKGNYGIEALEDAYKAYCNSTL